MLAEEKTSEEETTESSESSSQEESNDGKSKMGFKRYSAMHVFSKHKVMKKTTQNCKELCVEGNSASEMQIKVLNYNVLADSYH